MGCCGGGGKIFVFVIELLTGDKITVGSADGLSSRMKARALLDHVYRHLSISSRHANERELLGLKFQNPNSEIHAAHANTTRYNNASRIWTANQIDWAFIDPNRPISDYCRGQVPMNHLFMSIRYFVADPTRLLDDNTRTQFYLQLRKDLLDCTLTIANQRDAAELSALIAQIEYGDFDKEWRNQRDHGAPSSPSTNATHNDRPSPNYAHYAIGIDDKKLKPMTPEFDKMIYRAHKDLIGLTINEAQMRFLWKCHKLTLYGVRRFPLASDRNLWLGLSPRGLHLFEVQKRPPGKPPPQTATGVTEPPEKLDKMGSYPWMSVTQIDYCDKLFEFHHTASTQLGSTDTVTLECPSKYTCKTLWRTAVEFHNFYKVQRGHDCMDSRRSSGVFTRHDRLSLHNADFHGSQTNHSFGLAASRAGSQTNMDQLSRHGSAVGIYTDGETMHPYPSKYSLARKNFKSPYQRTVSASKIAHTDTEFIKPSGGGLDQSHRMVTNVSQQNLRPKGRGAVTDIEGINSATASALVNGQVLGDDKRKQRMKDRMNDPRYKDNKQRRQQKLNQRIRDELRKHIADMEKHGNAPTMPQDGEIQYIQIQTNAGQGGGKPKSTTGARSRGHYTDMDGPMGRNQKSAIPARELAQYQRQIKDYVRQHQHVLPPGALDKGSSSPSKILPPPLSTQTTPTRPGHRMENGLVAPLPITKQVLSEEEFNQTQKDHLQSPHVQISSRNPASQFPPAQRTTGNVPSPKKFHHSPAGGAYSYQNQYGSQPEPYHRQVPAGKPTSRASDKRGGYNSDWDVKYQYHPPPKYNNNRPITHGNGMSASQFQQSKPQHSPGRNASGSQHGGHRTSQHSVSHQAKDEMKLSASYGTQV